MKFKSLIKAKYIYVFLFTAHPYHKKKSLNEIFFLFSITKSALLQKNLLFLDKIITFNSSQKKKFLSKFWLSIKYSNHYLYDIEQQGKQKNRKKINNRPCGTEEDSGIYEDGRRGRLTKGTRKKKIALLTLTVLNRMKPHKEKKIQLWCHLQNLKKEYYVIIRVYK